MTRHMGSFLLHAVIGRDTSDLTLPITEVGKPRVLAQPLSYWPRPTSRSAGSASFVSFSSPLGPHSMIQPCAKCFQMRVRLGLAEPASKTKTTKSCLCTELPASLRLLPEVD